MTENQKLDHLWDTVVNECYCIWDIFVEHAGGLEKIKSEIRDLATKKELDEYINKFI